MSAWDYVKFATPAPQFQFRKFVNLATPEIGHLGALSITNYTGVESMLKASLRLPRKHPKSLQVPTPNPPNKPKGNPTLLDMLSLCLKPPRVLR